MGEGHEDHRIKGILNSTFTDGLVTSGFSHQTGWPKKNEKSERARP